MNPAPARSASPSSPPEVHGIRGWRRALLLPFGLLVRAWGASLRFETTPETVTIFRNTHEPVVFASWHNRLFIATEIFRRFRQGHHVYCLISASKDGAWLSEFFALGGMRTVRGSSSKLGREAVTALVDVMRAGHDIGITPDGPRGPLYGFKAGGLIVARRVRAPVILLGGSFDSSWQLGSWDRFHLPKPFSRVRLKCELVPSDELADRDEAAEKLRQRLLAISSDRRSDEAAPVI